MELGNIVVVVVVVVVVVAIVLVLFGIQGIQGSQGFMIYYVRSAIKIEIKAKHSASIFEKSATFICSITLSCFTLPYSLENKVGILKLKNILKFIETIKLRKYWPQSKSKSVSGIQILYRVSRVVFVQIQFQVQNQIGGNNDFFYTLLERNCTYPPKWRAELGTH